MKNTSTNNFENYRSDIYSKIIKLLSLNDLSKIFGQVWKNDKNIMPDIKGHRCENFL